MKAIAAIVTVFYGFLISSPIARAQTWMPTRANTNNEWGPVAASADGTKLAAIGWTNNYYEAYIFLSTNSGATWTQSIAPFESWEWIVCSADGSKLAAQYGTSSQFYISTNSGATWGAGGNFDGITSYLASSADGNTLMTLAKGGGIWVSTNSGTTWLLATNVSKYWASGTCAADGKDMAALVSGDASFLYLSTNAGITWRGTPVLGNADQGVVSTADGSKLLINGYISTNWGLTWSPTNIGIVFPVVCSEDGSVMASVYPTFVNGGYVSDVYTSTNLGASWISNNLPQKGWTWVTCSADGKKLVATAGGYTLATNGIWIAQTVPSPQLNLKSLAPNLNFSWLAPSTNMALEESPDLMNWTTVTNVPSLNYTNLQEQLMLTQTSSNGFFRLVSQ